jgi:hypothetical protein
MAKRDDKETETKEEKKARIKIRGGSGEQLELKNPTSSGKTGLRGAREYTGSRWAALWLLILTMVVGVWFYIQGSGGWKEMKFKWPEWGGKSEWVFER